LAVQSGAPKFPAQRIKTLLQLYPYKTGAVCSSAGLESKKLVLQIYCSGSHTFSG